MTERDIWKMTISGKLLRDAFISGANNIYNNRREVDELNVFPVPDGDTGTNMSMTIKNALAELENVPDGATVGEVTKKAASAMLRGARKLGRYSVAAVQRTFKGSFGKRDRKRRGLVRVAENRC